MRKDLKMKNYEFTTEFDDQHLLKEYENENNDISFNVSLSNSFNRLDIKTSKLKHQYKSYADMINKLRQRVMSKKPEKIITNKNQKLVFKPTISDLSDVIIDCCDIALMRSTKQEPILFIENPDNHMMIQQRSFFESIITDISSRRIVKDNEYKEVTVQIEISDIALTTEKVVKKIKNDSTVRDFVPLPANYVITKNDLVIKLDDNKVFDLKDIRLQFDVTNKSYFNIHSPKMKLSDTLLHQRSLYNEIINRVMKDWSDNDKEVEYLLWQIIYAVLQGNNHNKFIVLKGPGGNGKSTYMELLSIVASKEFTIYANIHQFGDPNAINKLDFSTKLIIGDDAATNHKISDLALSNLKSIITGNPISLAVKYKDNVIIQTNALFVQGTNTDLNFYENNAALKSRLILIPWTSTDFRSQKRELTFDLDTLMKKQLFIDTWINMCLEKVEYFNEFSIPEKVKNATNEMVESNDTIKQFLDEEYYKINYIRYIPLKVLFQRFEEWRKVNNPNGGSMKFSNFVRQVDAKSNEYDFITHISDRKRFKSEKSSLSVAELLMINDISSLDLDKQPYVENKEFIKIDDIDKMINQVKHPIAEDDLTSRDIQTIRLAIDVKQQTFLKSIYALHL